jgi:hypothetical protein
LAAQGLPLPLADDDRNQTAKTAEEKRCTDQDAPGNCESAG